MRVGLGRPVTELVREPVVLAALDPVQFLRRVRIGTVLDAEQAALPVPGEVIGVPEAVGEDLDALLAHAGLRAKRGVHERRDAAVGGAQRFEGKFNVGLYEAIQAMLKSDEVMMAKVIARECRRALGAALDECTRQLTSEMAQMVTRVREDRSRSLDGLEAILDGLALVDAPKALVVMSEGLILDNPTDVDAVVRAASRAQASINVLLMDVPRGSDLARGPIMPPTMTEDRDLQVNGLRELAAASRGSLYNIAGNGALIFDRLASELLSNPLIEAYEVEPLGVAGAGAAR